MPVPRQPSAARAVAQQALFEPAAAGAGAEGAVGAAETLDALIAVHADQLSRIGRDEHPARFGMLVAAESAGALVAAEMSAAGLPWRPDVHDALLTDMLGRRPPAAGLPSRSAAAPPMRPPRLADLAGQISAAFGASRNVGSRP